MDNQYAIEVKNLTKYYGRLKAIDNICFDIKKGAVVGFLGPNGAGKSTTIRILSGFIPASSGSAFVSNISVARFPLLIKKKIGYMLENNPLPGHLTVSEYLTFRASLKNVSDIKKNVSQAMEFCDLKYKVPNQLISNLSKGYRQRVGIAEAILGEPEILILDEPTVGLDPHQIISVRKLIEYLREKMTIVFSSHILSEIENICSSVIILNHGKVVTNGQIEDLKHEFEKQFKKTRIVISNSTNNNFEQISSCLTDIQILSKKSAGKNATEITFESKYKKSELENILNDLEKNKKTIQEWSILSPDLESIFLEATRSDWKKIENEKNTIIKNNIF